MSVSLTSLDLTKPVDVYCDWLDECKKVNDTTKGVKVSKLGHVDDDSDAEEEEKRQISEASDDDEEGLL